MLDSMVTFEGVTRRFPPDVTAVNEVTLRVRPGDRIALQGVSGSGKSSLLALMVGLDRPNAGTIAWPGLKKGPLRPGQIGIAFQSACLLPSLNLAENLALPWLIARYAGDPGRAVAEALDLVGLGDMADRLPSVLSGGQALRAGVARALVTRPRLVVADEPTGQLDGETGRALIGALLAWAEANGSALIVATHDAAVAARMDRHWQMSFGRLTEVLAGEVA